MTVAAAEIAGSKREIPGDCLRYGAQGLFLANVWVFFVIPYPVMLALLPASLTGIYLITWRWFRSPRSRLRLLWQYLLFPVVGCTAAVLLAWLWMGRTDFDAADYLLLAQTGEFWRVNLVCGAGFGIFPAAPFMFAWSKIFPRRP